MTPPPDDRHRARHTSTASQAGFTMIQNAVVLRRDLSVGAKLVYGYLKHLAWRESNDETPTTRQVIARDLGVSEKTVTGYVQELTRAPILEGGDESMDKLILSKRRGLGLSNVYLINDPLRSDLPDGRDESTSQVRSDRPVPPFTQDLETKTKTSADESAGVIDVVEPTLPKAVLVEGRNLPVDALCKVCGIDFGSKTRVKQAANAINGNGNDGIRHLFWVECERAVERHPEMADRLRELADDPVKFEQMLADRVHTKADALRLAEPWRTSLSPHLIRDHWLDVENRPAAAGRPTSDEISDAFRDAKARRGQ